MISTWKAAAGIFLVFVFGCISGALSTSLYYRNEVLSLERSPSEVADVMENRFAHHLGLDPDQHQQIHRILTEFLRQRKQLMTQIQPELQANNRQMLAQIRSVLRPDQMAGFHDNVEQLRRRMAKAAGQPPDAEVGAPEPTNAPSTNAAPIP
jgi:hypothetical protein